MCQQVTLYYCADGNRRFAEIAIKAGFRYGAQLPKTVYFPPEFVDQDFKNPRYVGYIQALRKHRPYIASVLDIMEWRRLDEYLMRAEEVSRYCTEVMLIPKLPGVIKELPREINGKKVRLGYSVPTRFGKTDVPIDEFDSWPVHLLGGSPKKQYELSKQINMVSCDGNYSQLMATKYNEFWDGEAWRELADYGGKVEKDAPYEAFRRSCENIIKMWEA